MKSGTKPLISVITVSYNCEDVIAKTIESVINQIYKNIEYIFVDGASKDSTLDIIKSYKTIAEDKGISFKFISEPDKGIYDAMNKALEMATGKWGIFMNSGDCFYNEKVLDVFFNRRIDIKNYTFIIGDTLRKYSNSTFRSKPAYFCSPIKGMGFSHQSIFFDLSFHKKNTFEMEYKLMGDFNFFCKSVHLNKKYLQLPEIVSIFETGGVSRIRWKLNIRERYKIFKSYIKNPSFKEYMEFYIVIIKYLIVTLVIGEQYLKNIKKSVKA